MDKTVIISAFPCCGKSYAYEHYQDSYSMLDSDSSQFSWIKDKDGNNTDQRNPDFPSNYIQHIKDNIGKVDIIFVSSHEQVRKAMGENRISFCTVYPEDDMLNEWVGRMYRRGNDERFINFLISHWNEFMEELYSGYSAGVDTYYLSSNEYLDLEKLDYIWDTIGDNEFNEFDD